MKTFSFEDQESYLKMTQAMVELADTTIQNVKKLCTELRPSLLGDLGLGAATEWQAEEFRRLTGTDCDLAVAFDGTDMDEPTRTAVFRIYQEALTNVIRHAQATKVKVAMKRKGQSLTLEVQDNGKGITDEQISGPKAFGLLGMRERVQALRGELKISGRPSKGTKIVVRVPLPSHRETDEKGTDSR